MALQLKKRKPGKPNVRIMRRSGIDSVIDDLLSERADIEELFIVYKTDKQWSYSLTDATSIADSWFALDVIKQIMMKSW